MSQKSKPDSDKETTENAGCSPSLPIIPFSSVPAVWDSEVSGWVEEQVFIQEPWQRGEWLSYLHFHGNLFAGVAVRAGVLVSLLPFQPVGDHVPFPLWGTDRVWLDSY